MLEEKRNQHPFLVRCVDSDGSITKELLCLTKSFASTLADGINKDSAWTRVRAVIVLNEKCPDAKKYMKQKGAYRR